VICSRRQASFDSIGSIAKGGKKKPSTASLQKYQNNQRDKRVLPSKRFMDCPFWYMNKKIDVEFVIHPKTETI
jgi:hypothetical protein